MVKKKSLDERRNKGKYLNIIMVICGKPITNIIPNGEKLKPFPLTSGTRKVCPHSLLLFNVEVDYLASSI
jgi:hypothetical protein